MILKTKDGREVEVDSVNGEVGEGAHIDSCFWVDSDADVPDDVIDWLNNSYAEELYEHYYQGIVGRAEACAEAWKDGTYQ